MRVLVADDDPTAQKVMRVFLEKSGFRPEIHGDGSKVLETLQGPDAPSIVILDWMLPGKDGLALCREIRAARLRSRPYLIMFSSRTAGAEIVTALNAGADDFISKPFNIAETQARLQVARRLLEYQKELLQQIADNDALIQRNTLLGEIINHKNPAKKPQHPHKPPAAQHLPKVMGGPVNLGLQDIRFIVTASLFELRLAAESISEGAKERKEDPLMLHAWSSLVLPESGAWMDIVLQAEPQSVQGLFKRSVGREANTDAERNVYFSEISRTIANGLVRALNARLIHTVAPLIPRTRMSGAATIPHNSDCRCYDMNVDGQKIRLALSFTSGASFQAKATELREFDILAQQYPPPELSEVPLFMQGISLNPRFIEKIRHISETSTEAPAIPIHRPSSLARFFNGYL